MIDAVLSFESSYKHILFSSRAGNKMKQYKAENQLKKERSRLSASGKDKADKIKKKDPLLTGPYY